MLVPEQLQGSWRGFVVLTVINHSPELNCLTRTFLEALSLSHPEKQMVSVLPCICRNASQITRGVCLGVCVWKSQPCSAFRFYKNRQESGLHFLWKGKKKNPLFAAVWQMQEGKGHAGQHCNPPLGLHQQEYCFRRSFERNNLFQHFIWLQVPLELA